MKECIYYSFFITILLLLISIYDNNDIVYINLIKMFIDDVK